MRALERSASDEHVEEAVERSPTSVVPGWLPLVLMGLFLAAVARQGVRAISDPDTFWHLRLGHDIMNARSLASITEDWSAVSSQSWVPTQWLTEVVLAAAEDLGGIAAIAWLFTVALLVLVLLIHRLARRFADPVPAAFATGLTVAAMAASLSPRPHLVSYVLLCLTLIGWQGTVGDLRPRWWLVLLTWVWAMSHGMWFVGPVIGLAVVVGLVLDRRVGRALAIKLAMVAVAGVVVAALTPVGPGLLGAPFAVAGVGAFITEWQPPSFRSPGPAAAAFMVAVVVIAWARSSRRVPWTQVVLLAVAVGWILLATRTVALGALIVSPLFAATLQAMLRRDRDVPTSRESWILRISAVAIACAAALIVPHTASKPASVPSALDAQLDELTPGAVVLNAYELGGWLRWEHPRLEPVVDGMTEAYSVEHLRDYGRVMAVGPGWKDTIEKWDTEVALLPTTSPLALALEDQLTWTVLDRTGPYTLLTKS